MLVPLGLVSLALLCAIGSMAASGVPITLPIQRKNTDQANAVPVTYYPLLVEEQSKQWPEIDKRERHWALLSEADEVIEHEDLLALVRHFETLTPWIKEYAASHRSSAA